MAIFNWGWTWQDAVGSVSYILLAASYLVTNMVWLRVLAALALVLETVYLYAGSDRPLMIGVVWSLIFVGINLVQLALIFQEKIKARLNAEERMLREWLFPSLGNVDFRKLLAVSQRSDIVKGTYLTKQGEKLGQLHVITQGVAQVFANEMVVATLREGSMSGEVSFFRDDVATASVVAQTNLRVLSIGRQQLRKLMKESESLHRALHESIGRDLGFKLTSFDDSRT